MLLLLSLRRFRQCLPVCTGGTSTSLGKRSLLLLLLSAAFLMLLLLFVPPEFVHYVNFTLLILRACVCRFHQVQ